MSGSGGGGGVGAPTHVSIQDLYDVLATYICAYEEELKSAVQGMAGKTADQVDQATLLNIQGKVQTWGVITSTATGIVRAVGDGLKSTTQNIR
jgi:hypothetical protein